MVDIVLLIKLLTTQSSTGLLLAIVAITTLLIWSFKLEDIIKARLNKRGEQQIELDSISARLKITENNLIETYTKTEANEEKINDLNSRLKAAEDDLKEAQAKIEANQDQINNLLLLSMGSDLYTSLKKIASGQFGKYHKKPNGILDRELRYLRVIGYIEVKDNVIGRIPERGENLSEYVWTTETGRDFVTLREAVEQRKSE
ncbi:MAG: hypothetical protein EA001_15825 [Oscillatoriales cyanobacterium]|nr:MAG: hypothetical protein EA001_15825 [Oscillatoriales cyanobacterium]